MVFPLLPLQRLAQCEVIGAVSDINFTVMGYQPDPRPFCQAAAPGILQDLQAHQVDGVLLVPWGPVCHQSVGLLARYLEGVGVAPVVLGGLCSALEKGRPPRGSLVRGPLGQLVGPPHDLATQTARVEAALQRLDS